MESVCRRKDQKSEVNEIRPGSKTQQEVQVLSLIVGQLHVWKPGQLTLRLKTQRIPSSF